MQDVRPTCFALALLFTTVLATMFTTSPAGAMGTSCRATFAVYPPGTTCPGPLPSSSALVSLGPLGVLFHGPATSTAPTNCSAAYTSNGSDDMLVYTRPGAAPPDWPCNGGGCLTGLQNVQGSWTASIDFHGWHSQAVAATILEAAELGSQVAFLPLDPPDIKGCPGVTDLDVVLAMAELLQAVIGPSAVPPPQTINMSFGRLAETSDPVDASCSIDADGVACLVAKLVAQLVEPPSDTVATIAVAAAANHQQELFPASLDNVLAVGALDLSVFARERDAVASWETEMDPSVPPLDGLMPGAGICMRLDSGDTLPLPGGSSFSAAVLAGWLQELVDTQPDVVQQHLAISAPWVPHQPGDDPQSEIFLRHAGVTFSTPGSGAGELVRRALYEDLSACGAVDPQAVTLHVPISPAVHSPLQELSFPERLAMSLHDEAPASDPCSACSLCQLDVPDPPGGVTRPRQGGRSSPRREGRFSSKVAVDPWVPVFMEIDLHATWALEPGTTVQEVFLRFGDAYAKLHLTPHQLDLFASGKVAYLSIKGKMARPSLETQPSMVMVMTLEPPLVPMRVVFWDSAPIVVRLPPGV